MVPIEPRVFDLLAYLIANRKRVVSQEDLRQKIWEGRVTSPSALASTINLARAAIGDNGEAQRLIRTLPRKGFRFVGPVEEAQTPNQMAAVASDREREPKPSGGPSIEATALWRRPSPYRGLAAMTEVDSDFFFGRADKIAEVIKALESEPEKLTVLLGNSGVGKSSLAQAGVIAALKRQRVDTASTPRTNAFGDSDRWCFCKLTPGTEPLRALVEVFFGIWQFTATDPERVKQQSAWVDLLQQGKATLRDLLDATDRRFGELGQVSPPAYFLYIDQGEELYARSEQRQRRRFSEVVARGLSDPRLRGLMSLRSDFLGALQNDEALFDACSKVDVPPLREAELREVVSRPAEILTARFETETLAADIARRAAEESTVDAGVMPLLSYLLDDMWTQMLKRDDGVLRLPAAAIELGSVLADRGDAFLTSHPNAVEPLRRLLTLKLATVREDGEPTRRRAYRSEFSDDEWRLVSELADHPNRLLVTVTPEDGETYAEVAHEALFRRWEKLRNWIAAEREFLIWRRTLEGACRTWQATPHGSRDEALLMGAALAQAQSWLVKRREDLPLFGQEFIEQSIAREGRIRGRERRARVFIYVLLVGIIVGLVGWINQASVKEQLNWYTTMRPYQIANVVPFVLTAETERALRPLASFRECAQDCPEMIVMPAGEFMMGSPPDEKGRFSNEGPEHKINVAQQFAVSKFDVTFSDWDICFKVGGCPPATDSGYGRGRQPVVNVSWDDAQQYIAWFSRMTGKPYRLLSEAEWEYAARGGTTTPYSFGADATELGEYAWYQSNSGYRPRPVGEKKPNPFGLYDMHGNIWRWLQDCYRGNYDGAPIDGSPWISGDCKQRSVRGGTWFSAPSNLRSANRTGAPPDQKINFIGIRLGRSLMP